MRFRPLLLGLMILSVLFGCGKQEHFGGKVLPADKVVHTVISLSPGCSEFIMVISYQVALIGRTQSDNYPTGIEKVESVCGVKPNYERIKELKPDLIVYDTILFNEADVEKLKQLGIDTMAINSSSLDNFVKSLEMYGARTASEALVSEYVEKIFQAREQNQASKPAIAPKVCVLLGGGSSEYMAAGLKTFQSDILRACGADPIGADSTKFETVGAEQLVGWDPDIIVSGGDAKAILADPRLKSLKAIKSGHVIDAKPDVLLRAGGRVDTLLTDLGIAIRKLSQQPVQ